MITLLSLILKNSPLICIVRVIYSILLCDVSINKVSIGIIIMDWDYGFWPNVKSRVCIRYLLINNRSKGLQHGVPDEKAWMLRAMSCSSVSATSSRYALIGPSAASAQKSSTTTPSTVRTMPMGCLLGSSPTAKPTRTHNSGQHVTQIIILIPG